MYLAGLQIKVLGNKLQLHLMAKNRKLSLWFSDDMVFFFEFTTALLLRVMLLSIPDEQNALLLSILNVAVELMVRNWFFVDYISKGAKLRAGLGLEDNDHKQQAYRRRGQMRVMDGQNDMVVEYVTMAAAAAMVLLLPQTGVFSVPTGGELEIAKLARVLTL